MTARDTPSLGGQEAQSPKSRHGSLDLETQGLKFWLLTPEVFTLCKLAVPLMTPSLGGGGGPRAHWPCPARASWQASRCLHKPKQSPLCPHNTHLASEVSGPIGPDFTLLDYFERRQCDLWGKNLFWVFLYALGFSFKDHSIPTHPLGPIILAC